MDIVGKSTLVAFMAVNYDLHFDVLYRCGLKNDHDQRKKVEHSNISDIRFPVFNSIKQICNFGSM